MAYKTNAEKAGKELATKYGVQAFPTVLFVDSAGAEIDRIIGYMPTAHYLRELRRVAAGRNTYRSLSRLVAEDSTRYEALYHLAEKEVMRQGRKSTAHLWRKLRAVAPDTSEARLAADYNLAAIALEAQHDSTALIAFLAGNPPVKFARRAYRLLINHERDLKNVPGEVHWREALMKYLDRAQAQDVNTLNSYAWRMAELNLNLEDALKRAQAAVAMIPRDDSLSLAQVLDTEAEVLWKLGRAGEAAELAKQCIQLQPKDKYYQKQLRKFQQADSLAS